MGIFGDLFDFNRNGELDPVERAMEFGLLMDILETEEENDEDLDDEF